MEKERRRWSEVSSGLGWNIIGSELRQQIWVEKLLSLKKKKNYDRLPSLSRVYEEGDTTQKGFPRAFSCSSLALEILDNNYLERPEIRVQHSSLSSHIILPFFVVPMHTVLLYC